MGHTLKTRMITDYLVKIKILFIFSVGALASFVIVGSLIFVNNFYFTDKYLTKMLESFTYRMQFAFLSGHSLAAAIVPVGGENRSSLATTTSSLESLPVITYHRIVETPDGANITKKNFKDQMFALRQAGYTTVSLEDVYAFLLGEKTLPEKSFLLTFDDGAKDSYYPVDPLLETLDYTAVTFLISEHAISPGGGYYLNPIEIRHMLETERWEIAAHTRGGHDFYPIGENGRIGHFYSNKLWLAKEGRLETAQEFAQRVRNDLSGAKEDLEKEFSVPITALAFPFGDFGQYSVNFKDAITIVPPISSSLYSLNFYQVSGTEEERNRPDPGETSFFVKRIKVDPNWDGKKLVWALESGEEKGLPYEDLFLEDRGWRRNWGNVEVTNGTLRLTPTLSTKGAMAILAGTYMWENYSIRATIEPTEDSFSFIARYQDDENYLQCVFGYDFTRFEEVRNGIRIVLSEEKTIPYLTGTHNARMTVNGNSANCELDGYITEGVTFNPVFKRGALGIKTWNPQLGASELIVREITVE